MAEIYLRRLNANSNVATKFQRNPAKFTNGGFFVVFISNTNVFSSADKARANYASGNDVMFKVKTNTVAKIIGRSQSGFKTALQIQCGDKSGYVYLGELKCTHNGQDPTFAFAQGPYFGLATNESTAKQAGLTNKDYGSLSTYSNLNKGNSLDESRIIAGSKGSTEDADETDASKTDSAASSTTSAANNSNSGDGGDINVTYEFAVKVNPSYAYNIKDHLEYIYDDGGNVTGGSKLNFQDYMNRINDNGINYKNLRNIFGAPYQFLPSTDCRVGDGFSDNLEVAGYEFVEKILSRMPLLYITPGNTSFMGGSTENARTTLLGSLSSAGVSGIKSDDNDLFETSLESMLSEYNGKLYTIMPAYAEYFNYVNPMCRAGAIFLDIGDEEPFEIGKKLKDMHWGFNEGQAYEIFVEEEDTLAEGVEDEENTEKNSEDKTEEEETEPKKQKFEETYEFTKNSEGTFKDLQSMLYYGNAIPFYINSDASFQDSFSNETTESSLSSTINALSDKAREIQFLLGTASSAVGEAFDKVDGTLSEIKTQINNIVDKVAGGNSIFTTIANSVKTIVSGGRMLFPQIWSNSTFSRSYNISIKLTTPNYDKISWWLNIYVPLCHLMALVLPRSEYVNSYTTPFIIKGFYKGMFNIDMGIITEMTFNKGKDGSWTKDALPTIVEVSFTIQDLYSSMGMTSLGSMFKGMTLQNVSEMDYIANLCGININEPDVFRMVRLWAAFNISNRVHDFIPDLSLNIKGYVTNKLASVYNNFWF